MGAQKVVCTMLLPLAHVLTVRGQVLIHEREPWRGRPAQHPGAVAFLKSQIRLADHEEQMYQR